MPTIQMKYVNIKGNMSNDIKKIYISMFVILFESPASLKTARPSTNSSTFLQLDERIHALLNLLVLAEVPISRRSLG